MDVSEKQQKNYVGYEYKEIVTESSRVSFLLDGYENFGWEIDGKVQERRSTPNTASGQKVTVYLKRNRKIINKAELTRLQRNFEACVREIDGMEKSKTSAASMYAIILGIFGTAFMAGATFAVTAQPPHYILCILLAVPGFLGWIVPFFLYKRESRKQAEKLAPLIEEKYDEIYEICEKGNKLLY
ncbi:MAG: hypothetical protein K2O02_02880 [Lachnospiraceae bacterium]|nr:hypothetical protein [Lachnospiraceae bacterium]